MALGAPTCEASCRFVAYCAQVEICPGCGLGRTLGPGRPPELQDYAPHDDGDRAQKKARLSRLFARYLRPAGAGALLDIGCAEGILIDIASGAGWQAAGLDSHAAPDPRIVRGRFLDREFATAFDAVTMVHSLEHMDEPLATLQKCRALLRPGGRLLVVVPNFGGWWARVMGSDWQWLNVDEHRYHFSAAALTRLLRRADFRIETCRTYSAHAPSLPEMVLSVKRVFDWQGLRSRPLRGTLYRLSRSAGLVGNPIADLAGRGAELEILARPA